MNTQNRIYVTVSPRVRKALELCAALDGSSTASYAANLLSGAIFQEIEQSSALHEQWEKMTHEALEKGSWEGPHFSILEKFAGENATNTPKREATPKGWSLAGNNPLNYEQGVDTETTFEGKNVAYLRSKENTGEGFGTLMQVFQAQNYKGKKIRFSATVKSEEVEDWAGLWMRIDGPQGTHVSIDNMQNRPIRGTIDWQTYEIILHVPQESERIAYGILLSGSGQVWLCNIQFNEATADTSTTERDVPQQPENVDFAIEE